MELMDFCSLLVGMKSEMLTKISQFRGVSYYSIARVPAHF